jgi:hypothetical protein
MRIAITSLSIDDEEKGLHWLLKRGQELLGASGAAYN